MAGWSGMFDYFTHENGIQGVLAHVQDGKIQPRTSVDALGRDVRLKYVRATLALAAHQLVPPFFVVPGYQVLVYCHDGSFWKPACCLDGGDLPGYDRADAPGHRSISASFVRCLNHSAVGMQGFLADVAILDSWTAFTTDARLDPAITAFIIILWNISGS